MKQTDRHWEKYGKADPYYGVLTDPKFKRESLDADKLTEFFQTGEDYISNLFATIRQRIASDFNPTLSLDFGCGVGRLAIPLSRRSKKVHGIDVSPSMLSEAKINAAKHAANNLEFFDADDALSKIGNNYDFINSYYVLQHIPTPRGLHIFKELLARLAQNGVFALEVPYHTDRTRIRGALSKLRRYLSAANAVANLIEGNPLNYPHLEMNVYPLATLCRIVQEEGVKDLFMQFGRDPLYFSCTLIGRKPSCSRSDALPMR